MTETVPLSRQIAALSAEKAFMERRISDAVKRRSLRQGEADYLVESFEAAIRTLEWVRDHEELIRRVHAEAGATTEEGA